MGLLVSVIIPVYNVEKYLDRCIESIVNQTYKNLEIILVDDGSSDGCPQICDEWAKKDARIKVIHKINAGVGEARNSGLSSCLGEYIMFVDSDDYLSCDAVEILYDRMIADDSDIAIGKHTDSYEEGHFDGNFCAWMNDEIISKNQVFDIAFDSPRYTVAAWGKMYKRNILDGIFFHNLVCGEDMCFFYEVINRSSKISIVSNNIYFYFMRQDSVMHVRPENSKEDEIEAIIRFVQFLINENYENGTVCGFKTLMSKCMHVKNKKKAKKMIKQMMNRKDISRILKRVDFKTRIKWLVLNFC